jgi:hypothetical protein
MEGLFYKFILGIAIIYEKGCQPFEGWQPYHQNEKN